MYCIVLHTAQYCPVTDGSTRLGFCRTGQNREPMLYHVNGETLRSGARLVGLESRPGVGILS